MVKSNIDSDHLACLQRKTIGKQHGTHKNTFSVNAPHLHDTALVEVSLKKKLIFPSSDYRYTYPLYPALYSVNRKPLWPIQRQ